MLSLAQRSKGGILKKYSCRKNKKSDVINCNFKFVKKTPPL